MPELRIPVTQMRRFLIGDMNRLTIRANSPVQGAGAAILKCALGTLWQHLQGRDDAKLCGAVHDELILLVKEEVQDEWVDHVKTAMESAEAKWLGDVPAIADVNVGKTWMECH
jgi:DNA polymerase I-like protein with 3'-5' exonuclease and polymerase domains